MNKKMFFLCFFKFFYVFLHGTLVHNIYIYTLYVCIIIVDRESHLKITKNKNFML